MISGKYEELILFTSINNLLSIKYDKIKKK